MRVGIVLWKSPIVVVGGHKSECMHVWNRPMEKSYGGRWTQILQHADHCKEGRRGPDGVPTENALLGAVLGQQVK